MDYYELTDVLVLVDLMICVSLKQTTLWEDVIQCFAYCDV